MDKDIIILTCSLKNSGYCVAGIDIDSKEWIRLVAPGHFDRNEIPKSFMVYSDSKPCKPLDVVSVDIIKELPGDIQRENVLVNLGKPPIFKYRITPYQLKDYISSDRYIYKGTSSFMDADTAISCENSLGLYKVKNIYINVIEHNGRKKTKLDFNYNGDFYNGVSVTDPDYYKYDSGKICDEGLIVVSIPENDYNGNYYKFVSKIIKW